jgi:hypothetical protein
MSLSKAAAFAQKINQKMTNEANMLLKTKSRVYKRSQTNPIQPTRLWVEISGNWSPAKANLSCALTD